MTSYDTDYSSTQDSKMSLILEDVFMGGPFCDAVIEVRDAKFSIHRIILSQCSIFFRSLFENCPAKKTFKLPDRSPENIQLIIEFAYTGSVPVTVHNVQDLMLLADWLNVTGIVQICSNFLGTELCPNNCISIWQFTSVCYSPELRSKSFHYIMDHFEEAIPCEEFLLLSLEELTELLKTDDLNVKTERSVFDAILRWIAGKPDEREKHISVLLSKARLALTNRDYITRDVMSNLLVKNDSQCMKIVSHNLKTLWHMARCLAWKKIYMNPYSRPRLPNVILLAIGGFLHHKSTNNVYAYDVSANRWKKCPEDLECSRAFHGTVFLSEYVYCIGGFNGDAQRERKYLNTVCRLDLRRHIWRDVANMHCCRSNVTVTVLNGIIYAFGGHDGFHQLKSAECYNPKTNQWKRIANMNQQRSEASCTVLRGKIYICGGSTENEVLPTAENYNPNTNQWTMIAPMSNPRTGLAITTFKNHIYAAGGIEQYTRLRTTEVYDPETNTWSPMANMITSRSSFCLQVIEDRIFAIGGKNPWSHFPNFEYYDTEANVWCNGMDRLPSLCGIGCCIVHGIPNLADYTFSRDNLRYLEFKTSDEDIDRWLQHAN